MYSNVIFKSFNIKITADKKKKLKNYLKKIIDSKWPAFLDSFREDYKYSYEKKNT